MKSDRYIGLFRCFPHGKWRVTFPDLPGCEAVGSSFKEVFLAAREALTDHLLMIDDPPRPRSSVELMIDGQRDWGLGKAFVDAVMHPVEAAGGEETAPLELVANNSASQAGPPSHA